MLPDPKVKLKIKKQLPLPIEVLEEKINSYLGKNFYKIVARGPGYVAFIDDEYSDRKRYRSDYHTRIGEGKFVFSYSTNNETSVELIYLTPVSFYVVVVSLAWILGIWGESIFIPIIYSLFLALPILLKVFWMNEYVFNEIEEC